MKPEAEPEAIAAFEAKIAPLVSGDDDEAPHLDSIGGALVELQVDLEGSDGASKAALRSRPLTGVPSSGKYENVLAVAVGPSRC